MIVIPITLLLMVSLIVMLFFSRRAIKEEAIQKASQTLEGTIQHIDNILLSVEQTAGNFYFSMMPHMDNPDMMVTFARQLVDSSPYVTGCAIAFRDDYYKDRKYFMAYVHQLPEGGIKEEALQDGEYKEQPWFAKPMSGGKPGWQSPMTGDQPDQVPVITFCLPFPDEEGRPYAIMGLGVSISQLSYIISLAKPSPNSFCMLLDEDGSFIVHPDSIKVKTGSALIYADGQADRNVRKGIEAMLSGETGYRQFRLDSTDYHLFFQPYKRTAVAGRTMEKLNWSTGILYPDKDIFGDYNDLLYYVLAIAIVGMLLLFLLSRTIFHRQLKPLDILTESAQRIANGNYDEPIPDSHQEDEIGRLQDNFQQMQQALASQTGELEQLKDTLQQRGESLRNAYKEAQKADRMKLAFMHNMSNQMVAPAKAIMKDVDSMCDTSCSDPAADNVQTVCLAADIQKNGDTIAKLLDELINISNEDIRKEVHDA